MRLLGIIAILATLTILPFLQVTAQAQIIPVNTTSVCFLNYSAGVDMWRNCGVEDDWLQFAILPWEWITGGYFSMFLVGIVILFSYIKYHNGLFPLLIGTIYLPVAYTLFPEIWINWAIIMTGIYIGSLITYVYLKMTKEY